MSDSYPSDWDSRRKKVYERDSYECRNCGALGGPHGHAELHAHHIVPISDGGIHKMRNLSTLCKDCHNAIHGSTTAPTGISKTTTPPADLEKVVKSTLSDPEVEDIVEIFQSPLVNKSIEYELRSNSSEKKSEMNEGLVGFGSFLLKAVLAIAVAGKLLDQQYGYFGIAVLLILNILLFGGLLYFIL